MPTRNHSNSPPTSRPTPIHPPTVAATSDDFIDVDGGRLYVARALEPPTDGHCHTGGHPGGGVPPGSAVVLLHGAGSGTDVPVLAQLAELLAGAGVGVARLEMPYRVAGRRAPDRATRLDAVLRATAAALGASPLALAGRSMGARVACRCARDVGAVCVLALGFPLYPPVPARTRQASPPASGGRADRGGELAGAGVPVLVVQGDRDRFGMPSPDAAAGIDVHVVAGADHEFRTRAGSRRRPAAGDTARTATDAVSEAARIGAAWLVEQLAAVPARESPDAVRGYDESTSSTAEA